MPKSCVETIRLAASSTPVRIVGLPPLALIR
jgi:hypothetical protein